MDLSYSQTNRYCLNNSPSKQQYSFSKQSRFKYKNKICPTHYYTLPNTFSSQKSHSVSFTKNKRQLQFPGQKYKRIIPSPSRYSIKTDLETTKSVKSGISFTKQKRKVHKIQLTPSPLDYNNKKQFFVVKYSVGNSKKRLQYPLQLRKGRQSPGPAYLVDVNKLQKIVDKYVSKKCMKVYSQRVLPKFKTQPSQTQQNYNFKSNLKSLAKIHKNGQLTKSSKLNDSLINPQNSLNSSKLLKIQSGRQFLSLNTSIKKQQHAQSKLSSHLGKFGKAQRKTIFELKSQSPGPKYKNFSQFSKLQKQMYNKKIEIKSKIIKQKTSIFLKNSIIKVKN